MKKKVIIPIIALSLLALGLFWYLNQRREHIADLLEVRLTSEQGYSPFESKYEDQIREFYNERNFLEIWWFNDKLSKAGEGLLGRIEDSKFDGLNPSDYHLDRLYELASSNGNSNLKFNKLSRDEKAEVELFLTDAFFKLAHNLERGKVNVQELDSNWKFDEKAVDTDYSLLLKEVADGAAVQKTFEKLYPNSAFYARGKEAIRDLYKTLEKDTLEWDFAKVDGAIKVGEKHAAIPALRKRLIFWDYLKPYEPSDPGLFDSTMFKGLQKYQESNGMNPDGVIGSLVAQSLNKSPQDLIDIAAVNMERLRWMPEIEWDQELILVNIANYQLDYVQNSDTTFSAKVIVGKEYNESPTFTAPMSYLVFSPYWNVPPSITAEEIMPAWEKNPNYLSQKNMEVVDAEGTPVNVSRIKKAKEGEYRIRQKPGGDNSLGLVKFMFPNEYNIYIHDTPARSLFAKETRALSHGCIRIENPDKFAKILLNDDSWTDEKIQEAMNKGTEEVVKLDRKIPVILVYLTFWADEDGKPHFRHDIYERDAALLKALRGTKSSLNKA